MAPGQNQESFAHAIRAIDQVISQPKSGEPQEELAPRFPRMTNRQAGQRKLVGSESQFAESAELLGRSHRRIQIAQDGASVVRSIVELARANHEGIYEPELEAMILDARGNVTATVALRPNIDIVEANGNRVWAVDTDDDDLASIVVFNLRPQGSR